MCTTVPTRWPQFTWYVRTFWVKIVMICLHVCSLALLMFSSSTIFCFQKCTSLFWFLACALRTSHRWSGPYMPLPAARPSLSRLRQVGIPVRQPGQHTVALPGLDAQRWISCLSQPGPASEAQRPCYCPPTTTSPATPAYQPSTARSQLSLPPVTQSVGQEVRSQQPAVRLLKDGLHARRCPELGTATDWGLVVTWYLSMLGEPFPLTSNRRTACKKLMMTRTGR